MNAAQVAAIVASPIIFQEPFGTHIIVTYDIAIMRKS
jgi:hypothetical protein